MQSKRKATAAHDKYEAILDAALELFVTRGFYGTAVPEVARKARVAAGTIYHYFPSKEALVNALFRKWKEAIARYVYTAFPAGAPPREQFAAIWEHMVSFARDYPSAFAFLELHHHSSYLDAESRAMENQLKEFGAGFVKRAQALGVVKACDTRLLMELIFGAFVGMMAAQFAGELELDDQAVRDAEQACWDAIAVG